MDLERLSCRERVALLCDYLDGALPPASRRLVAAHRRSCLPCAQVLASLERTVDVLRGSPLGSAAPRGLKAALRRRLRGA